ncbi:MAG: alpha/beta fold hydrolase [Verrucomicrobiales bacterium]|nr:alpha/beta fold hydrolase [Verrucomicrobiales bacterium]
MESQPQKDQTLPGLKWIRETVVSRGRNFIYLPRRYDSNPEYHNLKNSVEEIPYQVSGLNLTAYFASDPNFAPARIWLLFGGNASVALDWLPLISFAPESRDAYLLFDYPGYGESEGRPERKLIQRCVDELARTLCLRYQIETSDIGNRFFVMGHSLGCAVALETAARHRIKKGILISPFTSVQHMGEMMVGKFLSRFAADKFDNIRSLQRISQSGHDACFDIIHGDRDEIIPLEMAQRLHQQSLDQTRLWEIPNANHNDIILTLSRELGEALSNGGNFQFR